jgi:hypothetical protein
MSTGIRTITEERSMTVLRANTWGLNFVLFALLADIEFRSIVYHEAAWDLFTLLGLSGVVIIAYAAWHNVSVLSRKSLFVMAVVAFVAAIVGAMIAWMRAA